MTPKYTKYRDPLELFLDDGFCNAEIASELRKAGFSVHCFEEVFPRDDNPQKRQQGVLDSDRIIPHCGQTGWLLVTLDKNMRTRHRAVIRAYPNTTIVAFPHTGQIPVTEWVRALIMAKGKVEKMFRDQPRPWAVQLNRQGEFSVRDFFPECQPKREEHAAWASATIVPLKKGTKPGRGQIAN